MNNSSLNKTFQYNAFISYSRKDKTFAEKLERALENYKPPKELNILQSYLSIFRDEGDMTGAEYYRSIEEHLKNSAKLIVICSPNTRNSDYVNDEIRRFARIHGSHHIVSILLDGIPNNIAKLGQEQDMAFPEALCEIMKMPLGINYIGFKSRKDNINKGLFEGSWYTLLAKFTSIRTS